MWFKVSKIYHLMKEMAGSTATVVQVIVRAVCMDVQQFAKVLAISKYL